MGAWQYNKDFCYEDGIWEATDVLDRKRLDRVSSIKAFKNSLSARSAALTPEPEPVLTEIEKRIQKGSKAGGKVSGSNRTKKMLEYQESIREEFTKLYLDYTVPQQEIAKHFKHSREWVLHTAKRLGIYDPALAAKRRDPNYRKTKGE